MAKAHVNQHRNKLQDTPNNKQILLFVKQF